MAEITLITGGCRSGKSSFAESLFLKMAGPHYYVATAPNIDGEMNARIESHRERRKKYGWLTIEDELDLSNSILITDGGSVLIECLTLWVNNLIYHGQKNGKNIDESTVAERSDELVELAKRAGGNIIFVTNEVGMGIMPENATARLYGDLVGRCNQIIAESADKVYFMVSGIPTLIKGEKNGES